MTNIQFYKFSLELNGREIKNKINFIESFKDIAEAKDKFNTKVHGSKHILLLYPAVDMINLIIRIDNISNYKTVDIRTINKFISILQKDFKIIASRDSDTKKLFEAQIVKPISVAESRKIVEQLKKEHVECYDASDADSLFMGIDDEDIFSEEQDISEDEIDEHFFEMGSTKTLKEALKEVDHLIGMEEFKSHIHKLVDYMEIHNAAKLSRETENPIIYPYHYIFKGPAGVDHVRAARAGTEVFYHLGIIKSRKFVRLNIPRASSPYTGIDMEDYVDEFDTGVVLVEDIFGCNDENVEEKKIFDKLIQKMKENRGKIIFITSCYDGNNEPAFARLKAAFLENVNFLEINFKYYSDIELVNIIRNIVKLKGCSINKQAALLLCNTVKNLQAPNSSDIEYIISKLIEKAIVEKKLTLVGSTVANCKDIYSIKPLDLAFLKEDATCARVDEDPLSELDEMVGLGDVKSRIRQISNFVTVRAKKKELGLVSNPVCLHMEFTGNPGTGKTTVARLIGRIFKKLGVLSNGHFIELSRENLIGSYIGQTAPKVNKAIKEALGGIMFIDEAYSLYQNDENDFGNEAIATLVKGMEDNKDDLVIIFAGYPKEMEKMINMNPGLKDRIAFKIEFPDYNLQELYDIFTLMCKNSGYILLPEAGVEAKKLIDKFYSTKKENFGNGRIVRKIFERIEIVQNNRICNSGDFDKDKISIITKEDILEVYMDVEIKKLMKENGNSKSIGFKAEKMEQK